MKKGRWTILLRSGFCRTGLTAMCFSSLGGGRRARPWWGTFTRVVIRAARHRFANWLRDRWGGSVCNPPPLRRAALDAYSTRLTQPQHLQHPQHPQHPQPRYLSRPVNTNNTSSSQHHHRQIVRAQLSCPHSPPQQVHELLRVPPSNSSRRSNSVKRSGHGQPGQHGQHGAVCPFIARSERRAPVNSSCGFAPVPCPATPWRHHRSG